MGAPGIASMKFAVWLVCATFFLHCLMVPTAVTEVAERSYKVKRGVLRTGLMPREAYIPPSKSKRSKRSLCAIECSVKEGCLAFNVDRSTGKCELFDTEVGGSLVSDNNSSYCGEISGCILLIGGNIPSDATPVEYYHPIEGVECNVNSIGNMSTERIRGDTKQTSGCYLPSTQQIVIRETNTNDKPPMVYGLKDESANQLPLPYSTYTFASTAASVGSSKCISCGGNAGSVRLNNCYQFDPSFDASKWMPIASMPYKSQKPASVSLTENDFFVMGGWNVNYLSQLYRFNVGDGTWMAEPSMPTPRAGAAAAPLSNTEFIVCGGTNGTRFSICEIYDTTQKKWRTTGSLNQARYGLVVISFGGDIYALGGLGAASTVEKYDRATGEWKMAKPMKHPRSIFVGVTV